MSPPPGPYGPHTGPYGFGQAPGGQYPYAYPPPAGYGPPPPPPPRRGPRNGVLAVAVLAIAALIAAGFVAGTQLLGADADVVREPVATAGANPFMPTVGTDAVGVQNVAKTNGTYSGDTPGLFGGTGSDSSCDRTKLSSYLAANPDKAAGWAGVLGVRTADVSTYVSGLTSVVLRSDTYVTNHGWDAGRVTSYPAVLQAGTAVLVDSYGNPVTRCYCGNPLTAPASFSTVSYIGPTWNTFSSTNITVISKTTNVVNDYTIVDVHNGSGHARPIGSAGEKDEPADVQSPLDDLPGGGDTTTDDDEVQPGQQDVTAEGGASARSLSDSSGTTTTDPTTGTTTSESGTTTTDPSSTTSSTTTTKSTKTSWTFGSGCPTNLPGQSLTISGGSFSTGGSPAGAYKKTSEGFNLLFEDTVEGGPITFTVSDDGQTATSGGCTLS